MSNSIKLFVTYLINIYKLISKTSSHCKFNFHKFPRNIPKSTWNSIQREKNARYIHHVSNNHTIHKLLTVLHPSCSRSRIFHRSCDRKEIEILIDRSRSTPRYGFLAGRGSLSRCQLAFSDDLGRRIVFSAYANFAGAVTCFRNASAPAWRRSTPNMNLPGIFLLCFCIVVSFPWFFYRPPFC